MAELQQLASHGSNLIYELAANSGSSWMPGVLNHHLAMLLLYNNDENDNNIYNNNTN